MTALQVRSTEKRYKRIVKEVPEYEWDKLQGVVGQVKSFFVPGRFKYKKSGENALCQVKGCTEEAMWVATHKDKPCFLCFGHGEEA